MEEKVAAIANTSSYKLISVATSSLNLRLETTGGIGRAVFS